MLSGIGWDRVLVIGGIIEIFRDIDVFGKEFMVGDYFFSEDYIWENLNMVK